MQFIADFHVHSKYSRATAKNLDLEHLYVAAQKKGITVVGTGDFTHPSWFAEIREKLTEAEAGLFRLKPDIARELDRRVPPCCHRPVRFVLTAEISNIYKKQGKTRKNHNLVFLSGIESVRRFNGALDRIGNICSDGRPILGLDARDLLESVLEAESDGFLVPAHIWTPWFSLLGAQSGFDSIEECFEDLSPYVFALETGLSSDPPMNWRCSGLDGRTLISNSDAHSPDKLGREANRFNTELSYPAIRKALCSGNARQFEGTYEFYPQEGKYHLDGHRKCGVRMHPNETRMARNQCPVCGKTLTLGVLHRVLELADRPSGDLPEKRHRYWNLIPLKEILAEIFQVGPAAKRVSEAYEMLLARYGSEFRILTEIEPEVFDSGPIPLLSEAIGRMRTGRIHAAAGYDGAYGTIGLFDVRERRQLKGQRSLFACTDVEKPVAECGGPLDRIDRRSKYRPAIEPEKREKSDSEGSLNPEQQEAVRHCGTGLMIVAGPGTGKTRTLTHRIADLIERKKVPPDSILALTFTRKAADEMRQRLRDLLSGATDLPTVSTFHALCLQILQEIHPETPLTVIDDATRLAMLRLAIGQVPPAVEVKPARLERRIVEQKQLLRSPEACLASAQDPQSAALAAVYAAYQKILEIQKLYDYEDLIFEVIDRFKNRENLRRRYLQRYRHILVDEYQDLNHAQYQLIRSLTTDRTALFVIGDPNQAIYGFRGADVRYFQNFLQDYPAAREIRLQRNYRSSEMILTAAHRVITASGNATPAVRSGIHEKRPIELIECTSERSEAVAVGQIIEQLIGGTGFHSHDFGRPDLEATGAFGFNDIAVLFRTRSQGPLLADVLQSAGIPCQHVDKSDAFQQQGKRVLQSGLHLVRGSGSYVDLVAFCEAARGGCSADALQPFILQSLSNQRPVSEALQTADRMPIPGMKTESQRKLTALANTIETLRKQFDRCEVSVLLSALIDRLKPSFVRSHPNLREPNDIVFEMARESGRDLEGFLLRWALAGDTDAYDDKAQKVSLLTFHAAKGLEFPVVFITGCEEELLPLVPFARETDTDIEEERRLLYVAMTRARKALYLTWAERRTVHGRVQLRRRSRFIDPIPKSLLHGSKSRRRPAAQRQLTLF